MSSRLFVGGTSWNTTDDSLYAAFESFGKIVEAKIIIDRDTGRSKGFGFVAFTDAESAQKAIDAMDGANVDGRKIRVNLAEARATKDRPSGGRPPSRHDVRDAPAPEVVRRGAPAPVAAPRAAAVSEVAPVEGQRRRDARPEDAFVDRPRVSSEEAAAARQREWDRDSDEGGRRPPRRFNNASR